MTSYLVTFAVYTTAMIGVIFLALYAYKKFSPNNSRISQSQFLEVEDCVSFGVRKQLYVVRAGQEKFLIASDSERTTFLAKLNEQKITEQEVKRYSQVETNLDDLYGVSSRERFIAGRDSNEVLRNIVSSGDRR